MIIFEFDEYGEPTWWIPTDENHLYISQQLDVEITFNL